MKRTKRTIAVVAVVAMALAMATSPVGLAVAAGATGASGGASASVAQASASGQSLQPMATVGTKTTVDADEEFTNESRPATPLEPDAVTENGTSTRVTLITGQTVVVSEKDGDRRYYVEADVSMEQVRTPEGTYVFPAGTDFSTFDRDLFNVDLLLNQSLADAETDSIPVIVEGDSQTERSVEQTGETFQRTTGERPGAELRSVGGVAGRVDKANAGRTARDLAADPSVETVHLDVKYEITLDDAEGLVNASQARTQYGVTGEGVTVAILDTGINESHPALEADSTWLEKDFTDEDVVGAPDNHGHGTHVAGIVASNNETYTGIAPNATLYDVRVLDSDGYGYTSNIVSGMEYATDEGADVISMSLGGSIEGLRSDSPYYDGVQYAVDNGTAVVAAAGNSGYYGYNTVGDPGVQRGAITVGASDKSGNITSFSSRGPTNGFYVKPDIVAPGYEVASTHAFSTGFVSYSGTSMATPVVSGTAALMLEENPTWGPERLKNALVSTSDPLGDDDVYTQGAGRVDAEDAVDADVVVSPGTTDFGSYTTNTTVSKTVTVTNLGSDNRTLNLSASTEDLLEGSAGTVELNRSNVTLASGESATVELTVVTGEQAGVYSGRISLDGGEYTAIFGYTRAYELSVDKSTIRGTSVDNDTVVAVANHSGTLTNVKDPLQTLRNGSDSVTYQVVSDGEYFLMTQGLAEDNDQPVVVTEDVTVTGDTTVTLDESTTVERAVDMSEPENVSGSLSPTYVELLHLEWSSYFFGGGMLTSPNATSSTIRVSSRENMSMITERAFVTANSTGSGAELDSPVVYYLHNVTTGISGAKTRVIQTSELGTKNVTYARTTEGETYDVTLSAWSTIYGVFGVDAGYTASVGDQTHQTIYVSSQAASQPISAQSPSGASESWELPAPRFWFSEYGFAPDANESVDTTVNRHPYVGVTSPYWYFYNGSETDYFSASAVSQWSVSLLPRLYNDSVADRYVLSIGGTEMVNSTNVSAGRSFFENVSAGQEVELEIDAANDAMGHSTRTVTTARTTYQPGNDSIPPDVYWVHVDELNASTVAPNGTVDVSLYTYDVGWSNVTNVTVLWAEEGVTTVPFDENGIRSSTAWQQAGSIDDNSGNVSLDTTGYEGNVSIAVRAVDEHGNVIEITTFNGFAVQDVPPEAAVDANRTTVDVARSVEFDATGSTDNLGIESSEWDFDGDGTVDANGPTVTHNYSAPGNYTAEVTVTDTSGMTDTATVTVEVVDTIPPNAALDANESEAQVNITDVGFDATNTTDNHEVDYYLWDFDDDGTVDDNTTAATVTHVYQVAGEHDVTVTAVDPSGNVANASVFINVTDTTPPDAAVAANRTTVNVSRDVAFDAGNSSDNGAISHYLWDFDADGTPDANTTGPAIVSAYEEPGNYTAEVTVVDTADNTDVATVAVEVVDEIPPNAAGSANPTTAEINLTDVGFDASASTDNHEIVEYRWDFQNDGGVDATTSGPTTTHVYEAFGDHTATVTVEDASGNTDEVTVATITVQDTTPPDAVATANDTRTNISKTVAFDAADSTDNDEIASYEWTFDDGSASETGEAVTHSFADSGEYEVTVTVTDVKGNTATSTVVVHVWNNPPDATATANKTVANETTPVGLSAANSTDEDGHNITYTWQQVDGPAVNISNASAAEPTFTAPNVSDTVDVVFAVDVTDEKGKNDTATVAVTVEPVLEPPTAAFDYAPQQPTGADDVTFDASATTDDDGHIETYEWDFDGDGTADASGEIVEHNFANDTTFAVSLTVTDDEGATANVTKSVTVRNAPPVANATGPDRVEEGNQVTLAATGSTDPDSDPLTYNWTQVGGPAVNLSGNDTAIPEFEAPDVDSSTDLTFEVVATDDDDASDVANVTVTVTEPVSSGGGGGGVPDPADISVGGSGDIGKVPIGDSTTTTIYVSNYGESSLGVGSVSIVGPDADQFIVSGGMTFTVEGGETKELTVEVPEAQDGDYEATLVIENTDYDEPTVTVPLSYSGLVLSTPTATPTDSPTATPADTTPTTTTPSTTDEATPTSTGVPGFTPVVALVALLAVLLAIRSRATR